jgi:hypothetical protein
VKIREVAEALVQIEAVADEKLVGDGEADVAHRQVLDQTPVRTIEERDGGQRAGRTERERLAEVVEGKARVDDVLDDHDVPAGDLRVEVLEQTDASVAALVGAGRVARELEEVEAVRNPQGAREVGDEDEARLQRRDQQGLAALVVAREVTPQLADACLQLLPREVDLAEAGAAA